MQVGRKPDLSCVCEDLLPELQKLPFKPWQTEVAVPRDAPTAAMRRLRPLQSPGRRASLDGKDGPDLPLARYPSAAMQLPRSRRSTHYAVFLFAKGQQCGQCRS